MKAFIRRLSRLEDRFGPPVETEFSRRLVERLAAGRRRMAALGGEPLEVRPRENLVDARPGLEAIVEILNRGRQRMNEKNRELDALSSK